MNFTKDHERNDYERHGGFLGIDCQRKEKQAAAVCRLVSRRQQQFSQRGECKKRGENIIERLGPANDLRNDRMHGKCQRDKKRPPSRFLFRETIAPSRQQQRQCRKQHHGRATMPEHVGQMVNPRLRRFLAAQEMQQRVERGANWPENPEIIRMGRLGIKPIEHFRDVLQ